MGVGGCRKKKKVRTRATTLAEREVDRPKTRIPVVQVFGDNEKKTKGSKPRAAQKGNNAPPNRQGGTGEGGKTLFLEGGRKVCIMEKSRNATNREGNKYSGDKKSPTCAPKADEGNCKASERWDPPWFTKKTGEGWLRR